MRINSVNTSNVISLYNSTKKIQGNNEKTEKKDSIQLSDTAKNLSSLNLDGDFGSSDKKIQEIKNAISNGTYKPDGRVIAENIMKIMKERKV